MNVYDSFYFIFSAPEKDEPSVLSLLKAGFNKVKYNVFKEASARGWRHELFSKGV